MLVHNKSLKKQRKLQSAKSGNSKGVNSNLLRLSLYYWIELFTTILFFEKKIIQSKKWNEEKGYNEHFRSHFSKFRVDRQLPELSNEGQARGVFAYYHSRLKSPKKCNLGKPHTNNAFFGKKKNSDGAAAQKRVKKNRWFWPLR